MAPYAVSSPHRARVEAPRVISERSFMQDSNDTQADPRRTGADQTGSTDESIGRPGNWREGRYQLSGVRVDQSVNEPSQQKPPEPPAERERPVTRKDYEQ